MLIHIRQLLSDSEAVTGRRLLMIGVPEVVLSKSQQTALPNGKTTQPLADLSVWRMKGAYERDDSQIRPVEVSYASLTSTLIFAITFIETPD